MEPCLLYLISPPVITDLSHFKDILSRVLEAGKGHIGSFQLRLKQQGSANAGRLTDYQAEETELRKAIDLLLPLCKEADVPFILNDAVTLAAELPVDGVHLGQEDGNVAEARHLLGDKVIGVSCHASRHLAMDAGEAGADYVAFGAFYPTPSKSADALAHWGTPEPEILRWWTTHTVLPCVAIGGITPQNARPLIEAGADFIAVISSVWNHPESPIQAIQEYITLFAETGRIH